MDNNRVYEKLEKIDDQLAAMNAILQVQAQQLREHMRRTEVLEMLSQDYRDESDEWREAIFAKLRPVEDHVSMLKGAAKVFAVLGSIAALVLAALKVFFNS